MKAPAKKRSQEQETSLRLDVASLIDVSFLLLVYFLVTSTLDPKEGDLGLKLPGSKGSTGEVPETLEITVVRDGSVRVGELEVESAHDRRELSGLRTQVSFFNEINKLADVTPLVIVTAEDGVEGQRFIDVMNCLAGEGIGNVALRDFTRE